MRVHNYEDMGCIGCGLDADNCICEDYEDEGEEDPGKWECAFPGRCLMPGEHLRDECHTVEMYRDFVEGARRDGIL